MFTTHNGNVSPQSYATCANGMLLVQRTVLMNSDAWSQCGALQSRTM